MIILFFNIYVIFQYQRVALASWLKHVNQLSRPVTRSVFIQCLYANKNEHVRSGDIQSS